MRHIFSFFIFASCLFAESVEDLKQRVAEALPRFHGWCTKEKAMQFIDLVLEVRPETCVEIGVFGGRSLFPVASALKFLEKGVVIGIDPWSLDEVLPFFDAIKDQPHIAWWSKVNFDQIYYSYLSLISQNLLDDYVVTLRSTSEMAAYAIGEIDILYIDGNHNEKISNRDVELYLPKVRSGGYIWLNDSLWRDIQSSVDFLFEACDFVKLIDGGNCILFKKR